MRIFAIGDVHGHFNELLALIQKIRDGADYNPREDHLVLLGDLVDVGPDTNKVLEWAIQFKEAWPETFHPIRGNHDDMLLDALLYNSRQYGDYYLWFNQGGRQTVSSYLPKDIGSDYQRAIMQPLDYIPEEHLQFLDALPYFWETEEYFFAHGGIPPRLLRNIDFSDPKVLYDMLWIRAPFYNDRKANLSVEEGGFEKKVIFAHTPFEDHTNMDVTKVLFEPFVRERVIGINTMPRDEGKLTCIELPDERFFFQKRM